MRKTRADERTRTAYPCSLRVIGQALQGLAQECKSRINKPVSILRVAACCTLLRSRWYQSGISSTVQVSSTIQAELRLLACGWRFESVRRAFGLRRNPTGYS